MSSGAARNARALTLLIVWSVALGGLFAALLALAPAARAGTCDQVGGVITGDWTITNTQVCSGILYSVDGTISINSGGSLTLTDGGLSFSKDTSHEGYALNVNAGGELVLDHSIVTTQTDSISPFLKLAFTVSGANRRFTMKNSASLKFPGWFNATSATINVTDSKITGITDSELTGLGINTDDNNDAPLMAWTTTTASVYRSRIERLYEYPGGTPGNVVLTSTSNLYSYDSYLGVDYSNVAGAHKELRGDGTSNADLYNRTIDRTQDPAPEDDWQPAERRVLRQLPPAGGVRGLEHERRRVLRPVPGGEFREQFQIGHDVLQQPAGVPDRSHRLVIRPADCRLRLRVELPRDLRLRLDHRRRPVRRPRLGRQFAGVREDPLGRPADPGQLQGLEQLPAPLLLRKRRKLGHEPRERPHVGSPRLPRHSPRRGAHLERHDLRHGDRRECDPVRRERDPRSRLVPRSRPLDRHGSDDAPLGRDPHGRHDPRLHDGRREREHRRPRHPEHDVQPGPDVPTGLQRHPERPTHLRADVRSERLVVGGDDHRRRPGEPLLVAPRQRGRRDGDAPRRRECPHPAPTPRSEHADALHGPEPRGRRHLLRELDDVARLGPGRIDSVPNVRRESNDLGPDPEQLLPRHRIRGRRPDRVPTRRPGLRPRDGRHALTARVLQPDPGPQHHRDDRLGRERRVCAAAD